jgi:hypothetical protein
MTRLQALVPFARAAAVASAVAISVSMSAFLAGPVSAAASAQPDGGSVESISCTAAGDCTAVGSLNFRNVIRPLVVSEKNGTWGTAQTVPGVSALPVDAQSAGLGTVSCSSAGNCSAGGCYQDSGCPNDTPSQALHQHDLRLK